MRRGLLFLFFAPLLLATAASANAAHQGLCTEGQQKQILNDLGRNQLKNWSRVYRSFQRFAQCDGSSVAAGYSQAIGQLLTSDWQDFRSLARLTASDQAFEDFIVQHINGTLSGDQVKTMDDHANQRCPAEGRHLCQRIDARARRYRNNALFRELESEHELGPAPPIHFSSTEVSSETQRQFLDDNFTIVTDMKKLPVPVQRAFTEVGGFRSLIVNPGQNYQASDHITDGGMPRERLIFAGISKHRYFVYYEEGGWVRPNYVAFFTMASHHNLTPVWHGNCFKEAERPSNFQELRLQVADGKCPAE
jgi:hypothetical protein